MDEDLPMMMRLNDEVPKWLRSQPKTFSADGISRLVNRYRIYVEKG
jgi:hypothetical protein